MVKDALSVKTRAESKCRLDVVVLEVGSEIASSGKIHLRTLRNGKKNLICRLNPKAISQW